MNLLNQTLPTRGKDITIVLIAGHSGLIDGFYQTKGKRSPKWLDGSQVFEGEFNRQVKYRLMELLHLNGYKYVDLVPEHTDISIRERIQRAKDYYKENKNCYLLEIHANAGGGTGMEFYLASNASQKSKAIAQSFEDNMYLSLRWRGIKFKNFLGIYNYPMPCGLFEAPFMDTKSDCKNWLLSPSGRDQIAQYIFLSLVRGLETISR